MSELNANTWPFQEIEGGEALDVNAIFGGGASGADVNPFAPQEPPKEEPPVQQAVPPQSIQAAQPASAPAAAPAAIVEQPAQAAAPQASVQAAAVTPAAAENPISAAFEQTTMENAKKSVFEKPPVFCHKNAKEPIEDASMTFEELRIRKSEDFADLEEGKYVSWSVEYCGIRKDVKDPKGTTIISMKETIERSREFLEALKKSKDKNPDCLVKPKVTMKNKGVAASYKGHFRTVEEARASDKVICLIPSSDGRLYELQKSEAGEFIAPKKRVVDFQQVCAGFTPALPLIPASLIGQIIAFFRSFMDEGQENEAMAQIYWDKAEQTFLAYVPRQTVSKDAVEANLLDCPYDDERRYLCYADIHSHNSMEAFFSPKDDRDERGTGLYFVVGELDRFYPDLKARISCGGSFVSIDPASVIEGLDRAFPSEWPQKVTQQKKSFPKPTALFRKLEEAGV